MEGAVSIVMGLDQHRAQITAEWLDTDSGELHRRRVSPADRAGVRAFATRFAGQELDVALEATTGWRFAAEELAAAGARVHLAEPAESAALRGTKRRAKTDRADAKHLRELLAAGRLPESWIPPEHLLELRAPSWPERPHLSDVTDRGADGVSAAPRGGCRTNRVASGGLKTIR